MKFLTEYVILHFYFSNKKYNVPNNKDKALDNSEQIKNTQQSICQCYSIFYNHGENI